MNEIFLLAFTESCEYDRTEHDWMAEHGMGSSIMEDTEICGLL